MGHPFSKFVYAWTEVKSVFTGTSTFFGVTPLPLNFRRCPLDMTTSEVARLLLARFCAEIDVFKGREFDRHTWTKKRCDKGVCMDSGRSLISL